MIDVTVIIPVYNAEKFLEQCLDSVVRQTIQGKEVICVDDGSTDGSLAILKQYAEQYPWIHIYSQENQGSGPARNLAFSKASGRFVSFLDADDWYMDERGLEIMVREADRHNCLACACLRQIYDSENGQMRPEPLFRNLGLRKGEGRVLEFSEYQQDYHYQNYILSREMLLGNGVSFPSLRRYQDPPFLARALLAAGRVFVTAVEMYCYRWLRHSFMNGTYIVDTLRGMHICMQLAKEHGFKLLQRNTIYRIDRDFGRFFLANMNKQALKLLFEIDSLRIVPDEIRLLQEIGETKFDEPFLLNKYIWLQQANISFAAALARKGVRRVAVYGLGNQSEMFYHAVKGTDLKIVAALDKSRRQPWHGLAVQSPKASLPALDAIIVTPLHYAAILRELQKIRPERLISFRELIEEMHDERVRSEQGKVLSKKIVQSIAVTAILPLSGKSSCWRRALTSLCGQSMREIEILVILGEAGETIKEAIQKRMAVDSRIRILDMAKLEAGERLRMAAGQARGDYCAFCPENAYFEHDMLQSLYEAAKRQDWPELVKADYDRFLLADSEEVSIRYGIMPRDCRELYGQLVSLTQVPELLQRDQCLASGIYRTDFLLVQDILRQTPAIVAETAILAKAHLRAGREVYLERGSVHIQMSRHAHKHRAGDLLQALYVLLNEYGCTEGDKFSYVSQAAMLRQAIESLGLWLGVDTLCDGVGDGEAMKSLYVKLSDYLAGLTVEERNGMLSDCFVQALAHSPERFSSTAVAVALAYREEQRRFLQRVICTEADRQPGVVIFGTGERGCSVAALLLCHGYQGSVAFCDNNPDRAGKMWQGLPVYTPVDAALRCWYHTFVLPTPGLADTMSRQLITCGVDSEQIVLAPEVWPYELLEIDWNEIRIPKLMERN